MSCLDHFLRADLFRGLKKEKVKKAMGRLQKGRLVKGWGNLVMDTGEGM